MREPSAQSPFAAMTPQEQRHRWTVWQAQQMQVRPVIADKLLTTKDKNRQETEQTDVCTLLEELPAKTQQETVQEITPLRAAIRHSQYDAVIKRMKQASQQAAHYTSVPGAASTRQPSSGNP